MELITYLKTFGIEKLQEEYDIKAIYSLKFPELVALCYEHTKTPKNAITNECRGIVLNKNTFEIIAYPFTRFGDYEPKKETNFDFSDFKCFDKIDGSLISLYFYGDQWNIATKSMPDGRGKIFELDKTHEQLFWEIWDEKGLDMPIHKDFTYIFELKYPSNRQFITQTKNKTIHLIGLRNIRTFEEMDVEEALKANIIPQWHIAPLKAMKNISEIWEIAITLDPATDEGFVLLDKKFNRLKVKSPAYELIALLRSENKDPLLNEQVNRDNFKRLLSIAKYTSEKGFLKRYPHCATDFERIIKAKVLLAEKLEHILQEVRPLEGADFGQYCKKSDFQRFIFHLKKFDNTLLFLKECSESAFSEMITLIIKENNL
jgi:hypothetical protein